MEQSTQNNLKTGSDLDPRIRSALDQQHLDYQEMFGNANPVEIEIGCGRGKFLVARARLDHKTNFIGVDKCGKWMKRGVKKQQRDELKHLQFFRSEAREFLLRVPAKSVSAFHLYFLDPWPKKKHGDRRLITFDFLTLLRARLISGGKVEIATDDAPYFKEINRAVEQINVLWSEVKIQINERIVFPELKTNYELKWEKEGRTLHYMELVKP